MEDKSLDPIFSLSPEFEEKIHAALTKPKALKKLLDPLHPSDIAALLLQIDPETRFHILENLKGDFEPEILSHLDDTLREEVVRILGTKEVAAALTELGSDEAVDILDDLDEEGQQEILAAVSLQDRYILEQGLNYPEDSAGRLMRREVVTVPSHWRAEQVHDFLIENGDNLPDNFHSMYVVDPKYRPVGKIDVSQFVRAKKATKIGKIIDENLSTILVTTNQENVANLFRHYNLLSAPVVDDEGRMLGEITLDDILHVVDEEAEDDMMKLGGVRDSDMYSAVFDTTKARFSWLFINLFTAILASSVISMFAHSIEKLVALAVIMPIVASMGGNAGTQTLTVAVRALASQELQLGRSRRFIRKEVLVAFFNGLLFCFITASFTFFWFHDWKLAAVAGAAMIINLLAAGAAGILIPLTLTRLKIDPAVSSVVFLTTVTDVLGFFAFLGLATLFLL